MKPTDKERREVAQKLRKNAEEHPNMQLILNVAFACDSLRPEGAMDWNVTSHDAAMYLADLIDPTCRACLRTLLHPATEFTPEFEEDVYVCSECGEVLSYDEDFDPDTDYPAYCESCGFRVAEIGEPCSE